MDDCHLDRVARSLAADHRTRRGLLRLLAGSALGALTARLDPPASAAKQRQRKRRALREQPNGLHDEGKRKGRKGRNKKDKKRRSTPEEPQPPPSQCGADQWQCPDGTCIGLLDCCPGKKSCGDGTCVNPGECCYGEWQCADGTCVPEDQCCPDERRCSDGSCLSSARCCPGQRRCNDGTCIAEDQCCPDALAPLCPEASDAVLCCHGEEVCRRYLTAPGCPAWPERTYDPVNCRCVCPVNTNDSLGLCCPLGYHGSIGLDGYCCSGDTFDTCVCAFGFSKVNGLCRRT